MLNEEDKKRLIETAIWRDGIVSMEKGLKELGHKRVWELINNFRKPHTRIAYRNFFFSAGGRVPESEIKNG